MGIPWDRPGRRLSADEVTLLRVLLTLGALLAGLVAGLSAAAGSLALIGRPFLGLDPARIQLFLVVGPLLGLWPVALLCYVAAHSALVRGWTGVLLLLWLGTAVVGTLSSGVASVFR